jgi:Ca2+-binding EF-hand superfamily protein
MPAQSCGNKGYDNLSMQPVERGQHESIDMKPITGILAVTLIVLTAGVATARDNPTVRPPSAGPDGPLSSADHNRDGVVTHAEWEDFLRDGAYRRYGMVQYFDMLDTNHDGFLSAAERHKADPANTFDDVDFNHDGRVSRAEVEKQVAGRLYREMPGEAFFRLIDLNGDNRITPDEIQAAHDKGQIAYN